MLKNEYIPLRKAKVIVGLEGRTVLEYAKKGMFKTFTTPYGQTLYNKQSLLEYVNNFSNTEETQERRNIVYCRVSSKKQENDLQRQIELARELYPSYEVISDISSGINFKRKGLETILQLAVNKGIKELVVFHRDRLCRFGFELVERIIILSGGKVTVVDNKEENKSTEQELAEDLLSLIHVYSCRQMGKRRYKNSKAKDVSNEESEETVE